MTAKRGEPAEIMKELALFYDDLEQAIKPLLAMHAGRLKCGRGCTSCCVDEITVFQVEAENIGKKHGDLLRKGRPHEPMACAFLDDRGNCRIYESRPYVCRTQGLPLRWIEETVQGRMVEMRDICPLNDTHPPIESLDEEMCWTLGPFEEKLATLQLKLGGWDLKRIALRDLFA